MAFVYVLDRFRNQAIDTVGNDVVVTRDLISPKLKPGYNFSLFNNEDRFRSLVPFIPDQVPQLYRDEKVSDFVPFLEAYFAWLETAGLPVDLIYSLQSIFDPSQGGKVPEYYNLFHGEVLPLYPDVKVDTSILIKNIVKEYLSKGRAAALQFALRVIFGVNSAISYSSDRLYLSGPVVDNNDQIIRFSLSSPVSALSLERAKVHGLTSGAYCTISSVKLVNDGFFYIEANVNAYLGQFALSEHVTVTPINEVSPSTTGVIINGIGDYDLTAGGTGYFAGDNIPVLGGDGSGFNARVGVVRGPLSQILVDEPGANYSSIPDIIIEGDGTGATAVANVTNGIVTSVTITNPGTGYSYAFAIARININDTPPTYYAALKVVLSGTIETIAITSPGLNYTTAPTLALDSMARGSGAAATVTVTAVQNVTNRNTRRFRGDFTKTRIQDYHVLLALKHGTGTFTPGEMVTQLDSAGNLLFQATVLAWDPATKELRTSKADITKFDIHRPLLGEGSGVSWVFGGKYHKPIILDAGDGFINREYSYFINSPLTLDTYRKVLLDNVHPLGLNYTAVLNSASFGFAPPELYVGVFPSGTDFNEVVSTPVGDRKTHQFNIITTTNYFQQPRISSKFGELLVVGENQIISSFVFRSGANVRINTPSGDLRDSGDATFILDTSHLA